MKIVRADGSAAHKLQDAEMHLKEAMDAWEEADLAYRQASSKRSTAIDRLNDAQKALDAAVNDLRGLAPRESDWKQQNNREDVA